MQQSKFLTYLPKLETVDTEQEVVKMKCQASNMYEYTNVQYLGTSVNINKDKLFYVQQN